jgi:predicted phage terminase large subunit-like protein
MNLSALQIEQQAIRNEQARRSLRRFILETFDDYDENWHHTLIMNKLEEWAFGDCNRLILALPPRHGKSEIASRHLPAYIMGRNPDAKIISASYGADLARRMNRDVQRIIDTPKYKEIFPDTRLWGKNVRADATGSFMRNSDMFEVVNRKGAYVGAGVGGSITGMGFDYGIIDDPYKNRQDASSPTVRQTIWDWFVSTFYTRKEGSAKILIIITRWHEADIVGVLEFLQKNDPTAEKWDMLSLPAIAEKDEKYRKKGEALWPSKFPLSVLFATKKLLGSYEFGALYQQHPTPQEGGVIKRDWIKTYNAPPAHFDDIIQSWDMAFKDTTSGSYVVGQVWGRIGADNYLLDQVRRKMDFVETVKAVRLMSAKWPDAWSKVVEDKANGPAVISTLKRSVPGLIAFMPNGSKESRLYAVSPLFEAGNVHIPVRDWTQDYIEELVSFPNGTNDDQVDCSSQALIRLTKPTGLRTMSKKSLGL